MLFSFPKSWAQVVISRLLLIGKIKNMVERVAIDDVGSPRNEWIQMRNLDGYGTARYPADTWPWILITADLNPDVFSWNKKEQKPHASTVLDW